MKTNEIAEKLMVAVYFILVLATWPLATWGVMTGVRMLESPELIPIAIILFFFMFLLVCIGTVLGYGLALAYFSKAPSIASAYDESVQEVVACEWLGRGDDARHANM